MFDPCRLYVSLLVYPPIYQFSLFCTNRLEPQLNILIHPKKHFQKLPKDSTRRYFIFSTAAILHTHVNRRRVLKIIQTKKPYHQPIFTKKWRINLQPGKRRYCIKQIPSSHSGQSIKGKIDGLASKTIIKKFHNERPTSGPRKNAHSSYRLSDHKNCSRILLYTSLVNPTKIIILERLWRRFGNKPKEIIFFCSP